MATIRVNKNKNYTVMSNYHLQDKNLTLKAKGILSLMLSLPDNWDYSINGLTTFSRDGRDSVVTALQELEKNGYLVRTQKLNDKGQFDGYIYDIYEVKQPNTDFPHTEKPIQINNKEKIIKKQITKHIYGEYHHVRLTDDEFNKLKSEYGEQTTLDAIKYLDEYIEMKGTQYKSHYMALRKWVFDAIHKNNKQGKIIEHEYTNEFLNSLYDSLE